jgi:hypothetical protein
MRPFIAATKPACTGRTAVREPADAPATTSPARPRQPPVRFAAATAAPTGQSVSLRFIYISDVWLQFKRENASSTTCLGRRDTKWCLHYGENRSKLGLF